MVYWNGIEQDIARPSAGGSNVPHSFKNSSSWIADVIFLFFFFDTTLPGVSLRGKGPAFASQAQRGTEGYGEAI